MDDEANPVELVQGYLERESYQVLTAFEDVTAVELAVPTGPTLWCLT